MEIINYKNYINHINVDYIPISNYINKIFTGNLDYFNNRKWNTYSDVFNYILSVLFHENLITNEEINSIINLLQNNDKANVIIATEIIKSKVELSKIIKL